MIRDRDHDHQSSVRSAIIIILAIVITPHLVTHNSQLSTQQHLPRATSSLYSTIDSSLACVLPKRFPLRASASSFFRLARPRPTPARSLALTLARCGKRQGKQSTSANPATQQVKKQVSVPERRTRRACHPPVSEVSSGPAFASGLLCFEGSTGAALDRVTPPGCRACGRRASGVGRRASYASSRVAHAPARGSPPHVLKQLCVCV